VIRAVLDTNTIVSGVGWGGPPGAVLDAALAGHFEIVTSPALLDELRRVLSYPKLQAVIGDADELVEFLALVSVVVTPTETVSRDPDDDRLVEAALAANARCHRHRRPGPAHPGAYRPDPDPDTPRVPRVSLPGHLTPASQAGSNHGRKRL
jgi:uncharacterized protein